MDQGTGMMPPGRAHRGGCKEGDREILQLLARFRLAVRGQLCLVIVRLSWKEEEKVLVVVGALASVLP